MTEPSQTAKSQVTEAETKVDTEDTLSTLAKRSSAVSGTKRLHGPKRRYTPAKPTPASGDESSDQEDALTISQESDASKYADTAAEVASQATNASDAQPLDTGTTKTVKWNKRPRGPMWRYTPTKPTSEQQQGDESSDEGDAEVLSTHKASQQS